LYPTLNQWQLDPNFHWQQCPLQVGLVVFHC
jgi:hypothetical protein